MLKGKALGVAAEDWVYNQLQADGWRILQRNWRCPLGEIDLICSTGATLIFVEVRSVSTPYLATAAQTVSMPKQRKVAKAALAWIQRYDVWPDVIRFDVFAVAWAPSTGFQGEHIEAAFESPFGF